MLLRLPCVPTIVADLDRRPSLARGHGGSVEIRVFPLWTRSLVPYLLLVSRGDLSSLVDFLAADVAHEGLAIGERHDRDRRGQKARPAAGGKQLRPVPFQAAAQRGLSDSLTRERTAAAQSGGGARRPFDRPPFRLPFQRP